MQVVIPYGMDAREWVDSTGDNLSSIVRPMRLDRGDQWVEWGQYVRSTLARRGILTPDSTQFNDFEEWAARFNSVIANI